MSPGAKGMGSGTSRRTRCLRSVYSGHRGGINWLCLSPDGDHLLTCSEDGTARLWKTKGLQCCALLQGHDSYVTHGHLENDVAYTCSADHTVRKWDMATGGCMHVFRGHTSIVNRVLVASGCLFSGSYDRTARCWSPDSGRQLQEFRGHRNGVLALAHFSAQDLVPDYALSGREGGDFLVTGSTDCTVKLWLVPDGRCCHTLRGHQGAILCMLLDVPGRTLFTGSRDHTVRCWDLATGEQTRVLQDHQGSIICLEFVNRHLYSGSTDRTVKCWMVASGECVRTYKSHRHTVSTLQFHEGVLFTGSADSYARAFDTTSGILRRVFKGHKFIINGLQVHDQMLYTVSHDCTMRVWDVRGLYKCDHCEDSESRWKGSFGIGLSRVGRNRVGCLGFSNRPTTATSTRNDQEGREDTLELD
ncbi:WD repeat-containing protein 86-like isoform X1 [Brienomyrus brachyistius]|uniref:WD repeat-containing protein 86-like isoform X1 n=1 Tax=Brienomyrus brachyistius TaxID=42636 RepID=UPI0020B1EE32|nr:WD repeat-containing protein 86-like isoform X1 [Brienomyrus brachyistius]